MSITNTRSFAPLVANTWDRSLNARWADLHPYSRILHVNSGVYMHALVRLSYKTLGPCSWFLILRTLGLSECLFSRLSCALYRA